MIPTPEGSPDAGMPWHYGDPFAEQRAAARKVAVVDRSNREVIAVTGPERLSWLHLVISQHMTELADGAATEALVLDSQGRVDTHMEVAHLDETVWLDTEPGAHATGARGGTQPLLEYLRSMVFWSKVELRDATAERAVLTLLGPATDDLLTKLGLPVPGPHEVAGEDDVIVRRGALGVDLLVPRDAGWWERLTDAGARPMGSWGYEAFRVEAARPRMELDTDERTIPHEVGWVHVAAHVAKGCYRGQETVSKVHNVGRPPRRMLLLHLDGSPEVQPETGDPVVVKREGETGGERTVGRVGTVVRHHELGTVALALVKYSVPLDAELLVGAEDRVVQAAIDPDIVPEATPGLGREAARKLRG